MEIKTKSDTILKVIPSKTKCWWLVNHCVNNPEDHIHRFPTAKCWYEDDNKIRVKIHDLYFKQISIHTICLNNVWYSLENMGSEQDKHSRRIYTYLLVRKISDDEFEKFIPEIKSCKKTKEGNCDCYFKKEE